MIFDSTPVKLNYKKKLSQLTQKPGGPPDSGACHRPRQIQLNKTGGWVTDADPSGTAGVEGNANSPGVEHSTVRHRLLWSGAHPGRKHFSLGKKGHYIRVKGSVLYYP